MKRKHLFIMLALSLAASLTSCYPKFSDRVYFLDYSTFADKGFFITESNTVPFDYKPIGSVYVEQHSGMVNVSVEPKGDPRLSDAIYGEDRRGSTKKKWSNVSSDTALQSVFQAGQSVGADGIINLHIEGNAGQGIILTGMLIKRK
ncbi:MAG: hypothetical protein K2M45_08270 [Muribaculaceae bacterium]|nr:hypothetical protein [Muribaculaceae bacterium]